MENLKGAMREREGELPETGIREGDAIVECVCERERERERFKGFV